IRYWSVTGVQTCALPIYQHAAEHVAVLVNGAEEPGDVETARQVDETAAARHHHQFAVPHGLELGARHQAGERRMRRLNDRPVARSEERRVGKEGRSHWER